jgi:hypothetical protein
LQATNAALFESLNFIFLSVIHPFLSSTQLDILEKALR